MSQSSHMLESTMTSFTTELVVAGEHGAEVTRSSRTSWLASLGNEKFSNFKKEGKVRFHTLVLKSRQAEFNFFRNAACCEESGAGPVRGCLGGGWVGENPFFLFFLSVKGSEEVSLSAPAVLWKPKAAQYTDPVVRRSALSPFSRANDLNVEMISFSSRGGQDWRALALLRSKSWSVISSSDFNCCVLSLITDLGNINITINISINDTNLRKLKRWRVIRSERAVQSYPRIWARHSAYTWTADTYSLTDSNFLNCLDTFISLEDSSVPPPTRTV